MTQIKLTVVPEVAKLINKHFETDPQFEGLEKKELFSVSIAICENLLSFYIAANVRPENYKKIVEAIRDNLLNILDSSVKNFESNDQDFYNETKETMQ